MEKSTPARPASADVLLLALDAIEAPVVLLNRQEVICWGNAAWRGLTASQELRDGGVGRIYTELCAVGHGISAAELAQVSGALRELATGATREYQHDAWLPDDSGERGRLRATLLPDGDQHFVLVQHLEPLVPLVPPLQADADGDAGSERSQRKFTKMQLALANREARLREAERIAGLATWEVNLRTGQFTASPMLYTLFGMPVPHTASAMLPEWVSAALPFETAVHPEDAALLKDYFTAQRAGQHLPPCLVRIRRPDGSERIVHIESQAIPGLGGAISRIIGVTQDVTERRRSERALEESERMQRAIFEHTPIGIQIFGVDGIARRLNEAQRLIFGLPSLEYSVDSFNILTDPLSIAHDCHLHFKEALSGKVVTVPEQVMELDRSVNTWSTHRNRMVLDMSYFPLISEAGEVTAVVQLVQDVTARKAAQDALRISEERLRLAYLAEGIGYWDWDLLEHSGMGSAEMASILGLPPQPVTLSPELFMDLLIPEELESMLRGLTVACAPGSGDSFSFNHYVLTQNGEVRWVSELGRVVRGPDGAAVRLVGTIRDVTASQVASQERQKFFALIENSLDSIAMATLSVVLNFEVV